MDYDVLAQTSEQMREMAKALVTGLVTDGFTYEQARWFVVGVFTNHLQPSSTDEETD